jgi:hypothetical protein
LGSLARDLKLTRAGALIGRADRRWDRVVRVVERGVSEGEAAHLGVGKGSPVSHEAEDEGGEVFISPDAAGAPIYSHPGRGGFWKKGKTFTSLVVCAWPSTVFQNTHKSLTVTRILIVSVPHVAVPDISRTVILA